MMTTRQVNRMGKSREPGNAYVVLTDPRSGWTYEVLKSYQLDGGKRFARVFANVHGSWTEMGDVYVADLGTRLDLFDRTVFSDAADALGAVFGYGGGRGH
jgi:hypothetical protein